jgi:hypothetical protein
MTVVAAPCNDGEYRKLDATRGVRLSCPGTALAAAETADSRD